jgi:uncharacterized protein
VLGRTISGTLPLVTSERRTYLLVDGENIDATLGTSILRQRPGPDDRPRWDRVRTFVEEIYGNPVTALFFVNGSSGSVPMPFMQALMAMHFTPVPLSGPNDVKVVDVGIQRTLVALADRSADVILASHDGDFLPQLSDLLEGRRVGLLGFREFTNSQYAGLIEAGLELFDLEYDAQSFTHRLPRLRIIPLDEFDPADFLDD